mgnify:CR=1 FL=1
MAENKKSFVLYSDSQGLVNQLPDDVAGRLLKHIYAYVNDENPITDELLLNIAFEPIKMQLKKDKKKWEQTKEGRSVAGKASAEAKRLAKLAEQSLTNSTNVESVEQNSTNSTVNDNVNVNVINNNTPAKADDVFDFSKYLETLNQKFSRSFKVVNEKTKKQIKALLKEKYTKQDIIDAINNCVVSEFHKGNGYQYCTPEFFSRADILDRWSDITKPKQSKVNIEL